MTLAHMGGLHGLAVVWPPLVLVIGLWLATRISKEQPSEEEEDHRGVGGAMRGVRRIRREQSAVKRPTQPGQSIRDIEGH